VAGTVKNRQEPGRGTHDESYYFLFFFIFKLIPRGKIFVFIASRTYPEAPVVRVPLRPLLDRER
jgi:hypothetical protein